MVLGSCRMLYGLHKQLMAVSLHRDHMAVSRAKNGKTDQEPLSYCYPAHPAPCCSVRALWSTHCPGKQLPTAQIAVTHIDPQDAAKKKEIFPIQTSTRVCR